MQRILENEYWQSRGESWTMHMSLHKLPEPAPTVRMEAYLPVCTHGHTFCQVCHRAEGDRRLQYYSKKRSAEQASITPRPITAPINPGMRTVSQWLAEGGSAAEMAYSAGAELPDDVEED